MTFNMFSVLVFLLLRQIPERINLRRKDLFWLVVSEVSVHDQLTALFLGCGEAEEHGRRAW
jgi:hypothetical protein